MTLSTSSTYIEDANVVHTATVLSQVGEAGPVTIHDLIDMLYSKADHVELSFLVHPQEIWPNKVTWSLLYYLGIVTFDSDCRYSLRAPNCTLVYQVSP